MQLKNTNVSAKIGLVYTTIDFFSEVEALAEKIVNQKIVACVNIFSALVSIYSWKSKVEKSQECGLLLKTTPDKKLILKDWLIQNHPYEMPAIFLWESHAINDFGRYIHAELMPLAD